MALHDFGDSVFNALGDDDWETPFRLYSKISEKVQTHMTHEETVLEDTSSLRFLAWFVVRQVDKKNGPTSVDERTSYIMRINTTKYPLGKTFKVGDKIMRTDNGTIYRITTKGIFDKWTNVNRFTCEEFT